MDSYLYQIAHLGDDDDEIEFSSAMQVDEDETFFFEARPLKNLVLVDELDSLSPIISCQISDLVNEDTPQLYVASGRSSRSTLRILRHGLEVSEMAVSELPGNPNAVWTVKKRADGKFIHSVSGSKTLKFIFKSIFRFGKMSSIPTLSSRS